MDPVIKSIYIRNFVKIYKVVTEGGGEKRRKINIIV